MQTQGLLSRRELLQTTGVAAAAACLPTLPLNRPLRCINVVNFIRGVEPRGPVDLMLPVAKQMESVQGHGLSATWLLQFDALVSGPFVPFLKQRMPSGHEVGIWFEMNQDHCKAADVEWRGRPGYEWDWSPPVAFSIGYTIEERNRLVDVAAQKFREIWGRFPSSVASWNLDALSIRRFADEYGVQAFAVCRDQIATDGFTIWGAPIAGYYAAKNNCWSSAVHPQNQISAPVFRMLGQDPVYYYGRRYPLPNGQISTAPDTMEVVWPSGQSPGFVRRFLEMIADNPCGEFAYAQLGQENSFGWPAMAVAYDAQMAALAMLRASGKVRVETMSETGRRFKARFLQTPVQAQVQLADPFGHQSPAERTVWYQSRFYRANLHFDGDLPFFRDITLYRDQFPQPFLNTPTRLHEVDQRLPAILDGYHWRISDSELASGKLYIDGAPARLTAEPSVTGAPKSLAVRLPVQSGQNIVVQFDEEAITITLKRVGSLMLEFRWDPKRTAFQGTLANRLNYEFESFHYSATLTHGQPALTQAGWSASSNRSILELNLKRL